MQFAMEFSLNENVLIFNTKFKLILGALHGRQLGASTIAFYWLFGELQTSVVFVVFLVRGVLEVLHVGSETVWSHQSIEQSIEQHK